MRFMKSEPKRELPTDAAGWDARLRSPDCSSEERMAFNAWRNASARNQREYDRLQSILGAVRAARYAPEIRAMREWATESSLKKAKFQWRRREVIWGTAAAAVFVLIAAGPWLMRLVSGSGILNGDSAVSGLATAIGERSTFRLDDGSTIVLNTNTRLKLDFSAQERRVTLLHGQALFEVAGDPGAPFIVEAGIQRIMAVGTEFDVFFEGPEVKVTLIEGIVDVSPEERGPGSDTKPVRLLAGQRLTAHAEGATGDSVVEPVDTKLATIWRTGRVFFEDTPLSNAVEEMNRYSTLKIVLDDESLGDFRISGMFQSGRQVNFANALQEYLPVTAIRFSGDLIVLRAK